jgi:predicted restriction endonuclease
MSQEKKQVRAAFRSTVFQRDNYRCKICGFTSNPAQAEQELDAHHITDRDEFKNGGYVKQNGITLCKGGKESCHYKAEEGQISPDELYRRIGSSRELANQADRKMG